MNKSNKTWVKNMCKKLEDICTDIDDFVCKEPVIFVGNQMETVGANMKNFFSGFGDDFGLNKVSDLVHVAQVLPSKCMNLVETPTKTVAEVKENTVGSNTNNPKEAPLTHIGDLRHSDQITPEISHLIGEKDGLINVTSDNATKVNISSSTNSQNLDKESEEGVVYDESLHSDATAFEYSDCGIENDIDLNLEKNKTLLNRPVDDLECDSNSSMTRQSSEPESLVTCNENQEENSNNIIDGGLLSKNSSNSSFRHFIVEPTETVDYFSVSSDILSSCGSFTTLAYDSSNEADVSCSGTESLVDVCTVDFEDVKYDAIKTGAVSEGVKLASFSNTSRSKSYKKMIQDAFMSRKRLTKEYKQLAIWYGDIDKELCQPTESSKPAGQDLPDSEWELL